ncbi:hypothetical protein [Motiliproteus sp. MSK22-1]|uniref:hypothetical protein n=1 Tax=Motiliproteus sp. MSK22-1 TaxID=1897630 RepID=UPI0011807C8C|nr:hypothetical protein [Motiliproteus sp. MSK22-1]
MLFVPLDGPGLALEPGGIVHLIDAAEIEQERSQTGGDGDNSGDLLSDQALLLSSVPLHLFFSAKTQAAWRQSFNTALIRAPPQITG